MIKNIVFLCSTEEKVRERKGYFEALSKFADVTCLEKTHEETYYGLSEKLFEIKPDLLVYPDNYYPRMPLKIETLPIPSACFHFDSYSDTQNRIEFSFLFDYVFVSHPACVQTFKNAGLENTFLLPHAVETAEFLTPAVERTLDIGWVGRLDGKIYRERKAVITDLSFRYRLNDIEKFYDYKGLATVYKHSKIGVNFSRNDYPQDANLRCFEIMAGGALLLTGKPSELESLGFQEDVHYVAYRDYKEMLRLVDHYLFDHVEREKIARAGQKLTLSKHTYDARAASLLNIISNPQKANHKPLSYSTLYLNYCYRKEMYNEYFVVLKNYSAISLLFRFVSLIKMLSKFSFRATKRMLRIDVTS